MLAVRLRTIAIASCQRWISAIEGGNASAGFLEVAAAPRAAASQSPAFPFAGCRSTVGT
jgi:hypothetical protein